MERSELNAVVRATGSAVERDGAMFLGEAAALAALASNREATGPFGDMQGDGHGWLGIATGGTSGRVKFARHDERTLGAAVEGFCAHFGLERVNAVGVLPAYHVSGLMARVRSAATGGTHVAWEWKRLEAGDRPELSGAAGRGGAGWVISLVPTQLQRLLANAEAVAWLRGFKVIFVGGGPVWPELAEVAAKAELRVSLSYGMTETAAMVAALRPEEFLAGSRTVGAAMPHARIEIADDGLIRITGDSVFRGYWPEGRDARTVVTEDIGAWDALGHLLIGGRRDAVIVSGGKKIQPAVVEDLLRATGEFGDVAVIGLPDAEWGERVVACYPAADRPPDLGRVNALLSGPTRPKQFVAVSVWPRNAQGKLNRAALLAAALSAGGDPRG